MATIRVTTLSINKAGKSLATSFSDNFSSQSAFNTNWNTVVADTIGLAGSQAISGFPSAVTLNHLPFGVLGPVGNTTTVTTCLVPVSMQINPKVLNASQQFVQFTFISQTATNASYCPCCFFSTVNDGTGAGSHNFCAYMWGFANGLSTNIFRANFGVAGLTSILARGTLPVPAANDVWRVSADNSVGGVTTLRTTVNGSLVNTINDPSGTQPPRLIFGSPAFLALGGSTTAGDAIVIANFSCGVGL